MQQHAIERLLPGVYQAAISPSSPLSALLAVMEELHGPAEQILDHLEDHFDPVTTSQSFLPFLSVWVDLASLFDESNLTSPPGPDELRRLIAAAPELSRRRGTEEGLRRFLELATGVEGFVVDDRSHDLRFHIVITPPIEAAANRALVDRIVRTQRPAHSTYTIEWPPTDQPENTAMEGRDS